VSSENTKTIVVQSFRSYDVPEWIRRSLATVRSWAERSNFVYQLVGDDLLELTPPWYRLRAAQHLTVVTDLARLLLARVYLQRGFDRVIWIDADVVIFVPDLLKIDSNLSYGFCREVWIDKDFSGSLNVSLKVNNSACMFRNDHLGRKFIDEYISACMTIVDGLSHVQDHTEVGTKFLTLRNRQCPIPILNGFGLVSPLVMRALVNGDDDLLAQFMGWQGAPLHAVNLCNFFRVRHANRDGVPDDVFLAVLDKLVTSKGSILNAQIPLGLGVPR